MEANVKSVPTGKEFLKSKIKSVPITISSPVNAKPSSGTIEEHIFIGHSRNSRKIHYFQGSRD